MTRLHKWLNWVAILLVGAGAVLVTQSPVRSLEPIRPVLLVAAIPLAIHLAVAPRTRASAWRLPAMALNWLGALLCASSAALVVSGGEATSTLAGVFAGAAALYGWNAVTLALESSPS